MLLQPSSNNEKNSSNFSFISSTLLSACAKPAFVQSSIQTSNEGIFLKAKQGQSFSITLQNPSKIQSTLKDELALRLKNLGLKEVSLNADYEI